MILKAVFFIFVVTLRLDFHIILFFISRQALIIAISDRILTWSLVLAISDNLNILYLIIRFTHLYKGIK